MKTTITFIGKVILMLFLIFITFSTSQNSTVSAYANNTDNDRASAYLDATKVYADRSYNILHIINLMGESPPSSKWYGPGNVQISPTCSGSGNTIRTYTWVYGSLVGVNDYFYIKACNRPPGQYRVTNGLGFDITFNIIYRKYYLPLVMNSTP
jgi:hypothetical protein